MIDEATRVEITTRFEALLIEHCAQHVDPTCTFSRQCIRLAAVEALEALLGELQTSEERSLLLDHAVEFVDNVDMQNVVVSVLVERARVSMC
jgi:hypothetical protein